MFKNPLRSYTKASDKFHVFYSNSDEFEVYQNEILIFSSSSASELDNFLVSLGFGRIFLARSM